MRRFWLGNLKILPERVLKRVNATGNNWEMFPVKDKDLPRRTLGLAAMFALRYNCLLYGNTNDIRNEP
jgi:hypothetical protein